MVTYNPIVELHCSNEISYAMGGSRLPIEQRVVGKDHALDGIEDTNTTRVTIPLPTDFECITLIDQLDLEDMSNPCL